MGIGGSGVRRTRKRPKEPYRTVTPTPLPSKLGLVAAAPCSSHLVGLAAVVAAVRGPGPMITHRSGVGATGPFGQTERYRRRPGPTTGLSTNFAGGPESCPRIGRVVDNLWMSRPAVHRPGTAVSRGERRRPASALAGARGDPVRGRRPRRRRAPSRPARPRGGGGSGPRRSRSPGRRTRRSRSAGRRSPPGRPPTRRWVRVAVSPHTTQIALSIVISSASASSSGIGPNGRPAKSVLRPLAMTWRPLWRSVSAVRIRLVVEELRLLDADEVDVALARERQDLDRACCAARAPTGSAPCSGSPRTRRASGRRRRGGRAGSGAGRSRRGAGGAAARRSCPTTCSRR